ARPHRRREGRGEARPGAGGGEGSGEARRSAGEGAGGAAGASRGLTAYCVETTAVCESTLPHGFEIRTQNSLVEEIAGVLKVGELSPIGKCVCPLWPENH